MNIAKGETYGMDELPDSLMNNRGTLEWLGNDTLSGAYKNKKDDGTRILIEYEMTVKVENIQVIDRDDGNVIGEIGKADIE